ncbi:MAG: disulfide bond formation protein B [Micavibrio aeruginosavorus]|uniref:Disulfide bond formation protein B n=1 Tax=Micavibrio aeruginosavorus TaxID=349221 RepID=A0A7T5R1H7_9BACT|nr:MAG: disulfide bond formation protein B [Micavibrio aeruginosavorus]
MAATWLKNLLSHPVFVPAALFLLVVMSLGSALTAQYGFGMEPCPLCLWQRWPYGIIALLALAALGAARSGHIRFVALLVLLCALTLLAGGVIAFYHVGVEQHWWTSFLEGCAVNLGGTATDFLKQIESTAAARCDQIPWSLFGISMAGYNAIISLTAAPLTALCALLIVRRNNGL